MIFSVLLQPDSVFIKAQHEVGNQKGNGIQPG